MISIHIDTFHVIFEYNDDIHNRLSSHIIKNIYDTIHPIVNIIYKIKDDYDLCRYVDYNLRLKANNHMGAKHEITFEIPGFGVIYMRTGSDTRTNVLFWNNNKCYIYYERVNNNGCGPAQDRIRAHGRPASRAFDVAGPAQDRIRAHGRPASRAFDVAGPAQDRIRAHGPYFDEEYKLFLGETVIYHKKDYREYFNIKNEKILIDNTSKEEQRLLEILPELGLYASNYYRYKKSIINEGVINEDNQVYYAVGKESDTDDVGVTCSISDVIDKELSFNDIKKLIPIIGDIVIKKYDKYYKRRGGHYEEKDMLVDYKMTYPDANN
jgi:hypothetical protein